VKSIQCPTIPKITVDNVSGHGLQVQTVRLKDVGLVYRSVREINHEATGQGFRNARIITGISLREVARRLDVSAPFVSDLELGRRNWTEELAKRYAKVLK